MDGAWRRRGHDSYLCTGIRADAARAVEKYESGENIRLLTEIMEYIDLVVETYHEDNSNFRAIRYLMTRIKMEARENRDKKDGKQRFMTFLGKMIEQQEGAKARCLRHNPTFDERWDDRFRGLLVELYRLERFCLGYPGEIPRPKAVVGMGTKKELRRLL